jgi:hypothetical protein
MGKNGILNRCGFGSLRLYGYTKLEKDLRGHCATMLEIFDDVHKEHPNVVFQLIS